jgi:hypothetical protein
VGLPTPHFNPTGITPPIKKSGVCYYYRGRLKGSWLSFFFGALVLLEGFVDTLALVSPGVRTLVLLLPLRPNTSGFPLMFYYFVVLCLFLFYT